MTEGTFCEADSFTDADRAMLADLQRRERARVEKPMGKMADSRTLVVGREKREVFTFKASELGAFLFDVRGIKDAIVSNRIPAQMFRMVEIPEHFYQHVLNNHGVEPARLPQFNGRDLERPGIMVAWPHGYHTMIDGNHRLCRRYTLNLHSFRFLMVSVMDCAPFMCRPGEETELFKRADNSDYETLHTEIKLVDE